MEGGKFLRGDEYSDAERQNRNGTRTHANIIYL